MTDNVRMLDNNDSPEVANPEGMPLERPEEPMHYRNYCVQDATSYFKDLVARIQSLNLIPCGGDSFSRDFFDDACPEVVSACIIDCGA